MSGSALVAVSMRIVVDEKTKERRDALDRRFPLFLARCGLTALPVPNDKAVARDLMEKSGSAGLVLTGGADLEEYGGTDIDRDATELMLLRLMIQAGRPVLGICRGMQVIVHHYGGKLEEVPGHIVPAHGVRAGGEAFQVNSYHRLGTRACPSPLEARAVAEDGVVESVRHPDLPVAGIMWHPERMDPFPKRDIEFVRELFGAKP